MSFPPFIGAKNFHSICTFVYKGAHLETIAEIFNTNVLEKHDAYHPWDERYIYLRESWISMVNVGKYTSPMDGMGEKK